jgi:hypothetical protein
VLSLANWHSRKIGDDRRKPRARLTAPSKARFASRRTRPIIMKNAAGLANWIAA